MTRVLVITSSFPRYRGDPSGSFLFEPLKRLACLGHTIHVIAPHEQGYRKNESIENVFINRFTYMYPNSLQTLAYNYSIPENIRRRKFALLQILPYVFFGTLEMMRVARTQTVDAIMAFWALPQGLMGTIVKRIIRRPLIVGIFPVELSLTTSRYRFLVPFLRITLDKADVIVANSKFTKNLALSLGIAASKIAVIYPGIDLASFPRCSECVTKKEFNLEKSQVILGVGRLVERKGFEFLVESMPDILRSVPNAVLLLVGEGPLRSKLQGKAEQLSIEKKVLFFGRVPNEVLQALFSICDVFVLPAIVDSDGNTEGFGVVLLEAMSVAKPVVASKVGGIPEVVIDRETGILVEPKQPKELANAISNLLLDNGLSEALGKRGNERVQTHFTWDAIARQFFAIIQEVLSSQQKHQAYDRLYFCQHMSRLHTRWNRHRTRIVTDAVNPHDGDIILDLGCGIGTFPLHLSGKCSFIIGVDSSAEAIRMAKNMLRYLKRSSRTDIVRADVQLLPFGSESTSKIVCADLVEHLLAREYINMLSECHRVLCKSGTLNIYTPNPAHFFELMRKRNLILRKDETHVDFKTPSFLQKTLEQNSFIVQVKLREGHVPILDIIEKVCIRLPLASKLFARRILASAIKVSDSE